MGEAGLLRWLQGVSFGNTILPYSGRPTMGLIFTIRLIIGLILGQRVAQPAWPQTTIVGCGQQQSRFLGTSLFSARRAIRDLRALEPFSKTVVRTLWGSQALTR